MVLLHDDDFVCICICNTIINVFNVSAFLAGHEDKSQDLNAALLPRILELEKHKQKNTTISNKDRQRTEGNTRLEYRPNLSIQ